MAAAALGCGGGWRRAWRRGLGGPLPVTVPIAALVPVTVAVPARRPPRVVARNAGGGAVPAGKSGYGVGPGSGRGRPQQPPVRVVRQRQHLPSGLGHTRAATGTRLSPLGLAHGQRESLACPW